MSCRLSVCEQSMVNVEFGDGLKALPRLMSSNSYFSVVMADVFSFCHDSDTHLSAPEHRTAKSSASIEKFLMIN